VALVEAGQLGRIDEPDVSFIVDGIRNTMRAIGMLDEPPAVICVPPLSQPWQAKPAPLLR
jgi:hypothetical protein